MTHLPQTIDRVQVLAFLKTNNMKAQIIKNESGVNVPNFGIHTRDPLTYFIDVDIDGDGRLERFLCPVDMNEFETFLIDVLKYNHETSKETISIEVSREMSIFINAKYKDWYLVDEGNNRIPEP